MENYYSFFQQANENMRINVINKLYKTYRFIIHYNTYLKNFVLIKYEVYHHFTSKLQIIFIIVYSNRLNYDEECVY